jgi:hypothetical protein
MLAKTHNFFIIVMMGLILGVGLLFAGHASIATAGPPTPLATSTPVSTQTGHKKIITVWTHNLPGNEEGDALIRTFDTPWSLAEFEEVLENSCPSINGIFRPLTTLSLFWFPRNR